MKFSIEDQLTNEEDKKLFNWSSQVFPIEANQYTWAESQKHIIARDNNFPAAHLGFGSYKIISQGKNIPVIGVGDVVVRPEYQGQKLPSTLFKILHELEGFNSKDSLFSLFCPQRLVTYYNHFGYQLYSHPVEFLQKGQYVQSTSACFMTKGPEIFGKINIPSEPW